MVEAYDAANEGVEADAFAVEVFTVALEELDALGEQVFEGFFDAFVDGFDGGAHRGGAREAVARFHSLEQVFDGGGFGERVVGAGFGSVGAEAGGFGETAGAQGA